MNPRHALQAPLLLLARADLVRVVVQPLVDLARSCARAVPQPIPQAQPPCRPRRRRAPAQPLGAHVAVRASVDAGRLVQKRPTPCMETACHGAVRECAGGAYVLGFNAGVAVTGHAGVHAALRCLAVGVHGKAVQEQYKLGGRSRWPARGEAVTSVMRPRLWDTVEQPHHPCAAPRRSGTHRRHRRRAPPRPQPQP